MIQVNYKGDLSKDLVGELTSERTGNEKILGEEHSNEASTGRIAKPS